MLPEMTRRTVTYGFASQADVGASEVEASPTGMRFRLRIGGSDAGPVTIRLPGRHNVQNALATLAVAHELDIPLSRAIEALGTFVGIERRFEAIGEAGGVRVVDDYGHHPAEIRATLAAARAIHEGRILVAFQPHRYTRTRDLFDEFVGAFNDGDVVFVSEIYSAGEDKIPGVESAPLVEAIAAHGHRAVAFVPDLEELTSRLCDEARPGDLIITLGAGSISGIGPRVLAGLREKAS
jgi:UDP-N-acetylmuramate--alanine ligase